MSYNDTYVKHLLSTIKINSSLQLSTFSLPCHRRCTDKMKKYATVIL